MDDGAVPDKAKKSAPKTSISIDLLADRFASGINSQRWQLAQAGPLNFIRFLNGSEVSHV